MPIFPYHLAHIKDMFTVRKAYIYECKVMLYNSPTIFLREKLTFSAILNLLFHHFNSISRIYTKGVLLTSFANNIIKVNNSTIKTSPFAYFSLPLHLLKKYAHFEHEIYKKDSFCWHTGIIYASHGSRTHSYLSYDLFSITQRSVAIQIYPRKRLRKRYVV